MRHDELVKSQALAAGLDDSGAGGLGETESSHGELGDLEGSLVIGDGSNDNDASFPKHAMRCETGEWHLLVLSEMFDYFAERDGGSVGSGSDESSQNGLAESVFSSSRQELEELHANNM